MSIWSAFILLFSLPGAKAEVSAFEQALSTGSSLNTRESIVEFGGHKYRRVEYKSEVYYLQLLQAESTGSDVFVLCNDSEATRAGASSPALVTAAVRITKRTSLFIEGLRQICDGGSGRAKTVVTPELQVGFMFDDSKDPKAIFHDRKITINPLTGAVGFGATW